ncbi:MAG: hypothetical protein ACLUFV_06615 [Acutalibacteraceae bacterium]
MRADGRLKPVSSPLPFSLSRPHHAYIYRKDGDLHPPAIAVAEQRLIDASGEASPSAATPPRCSGVCYDYDLTITPPARVIEAFAGYTVVPTGLRHGTVTVHIDGLPIDVTTYRIDGAYADGRHPAEVRFTGSLEDDLRRRDFTMNAVCHSASRGFVDPFGGIGDIAPAASAAWAIRASGFQDAASARGCFTAQLGCRRPAAAMYETAGGLARLCGTHLLRADRR